MPEITPTGISLTTQSEFVEILKELYLSIDENWILDSNSPDGQFVMLVSRMLWELEQKAVAVRSSTDPRVATDSSIDDLASLFNLQREQQRQSLSKFTMLGKNETIIKSGNQIKNNQTGELWSLNEDVVLPGDGDFTSINYGIINVAGAFTISTLVDGWTGVENPTNFIIGRNDESDSELELRRNYEITKTGQGYVSAIKGAILSVDKVNSCDVIENDTSVVSEDGQAPNSILCVVSGGDEVEVCRAINKKISTGCKSVGDIEHLIITELDNYGMKRRFSRPVFVNVWVKYTIINGSLIDVKELKLIPEYVEKYAIGSIDLPFNSSDEGFSLGQSISAERLATPLNWAVGSSIANNSSIYTKSIELSRDGKIWFEFSLSISRLEIALFSDERVEVILI